MASRNTASDIATQEPGTRERYRAAARLEIPASCDQVIRLNVSHLGPPLQHPWQNCIAVGRAYELLRGDTLEHLRKASAELGYRMCRFHGIFHDDMDVVRRATDGRLLFQWHQVDKVYDALLEIGLRPFVELNPMPSALASGMQTFFAWKMNVTPPTVTAEWSELISMFVRHLAERYGSDEVAQWYFEVWNEPNLPAFWAGTKEEYWELYAAAAHAIKAVDSRFRVGGPASSKASWIMDLIDYCANGNVPLDFVSSHLYPQDVFQSDDQESRDGAAFFIETIRRTRREIRSSKMPHLEIHWTEWNALFAKNAQDVSWIHNSSVDQVEAAPLIAQLCTALDGEAETLCYWTVTDIFEEAGMPHSPFSATYGTHTIHGLPKASHHAFALLRRLTGPRLLAGGLPESGLPTGLMATFDGGVLRVLLWHTGASAGFWSPTLEINRPDNSPPIQAISTHVRARAGSAWESWRDLGSPHNLTRPQFALLASHSCPEIKLLKMDALTCRFSVNVPSGSLLMVEIYETPETVFGKGSNSLALNEWNDGMNAQSS